jgi:hypothetical protein
MCFHHSGLHSRDLDHKSWQKNQIRASSHHCMRSRKREQAAVIARLIIASPLRHQKVQETVSFLKRVNRFVDRVVGIFRIYVFKIITNLRRFRNKFGMTI